MKMKWLATTAFALLVGTGAVLAQSPTDQPQKRGEKSNAESPAGQKEMVRPAERAKERTTGQAGEGAATREQRQGAFPPERNKQEQEPQSREGRAPTGQGREQPARGERAPASAAQEQQKGRDNRQTTEGQRTREGQKNERAQDFKRPGDTKQTTEQERTREGQKGERTQERVQDEGRQRDTTQKSQQERDRREQAGQRSEPPTQQQSERERRDQVGQQQGQNADQMRNRTNRRTEINDDQRRQILEQLRREPTVNNQNANVRVNVGEPLPERVEVRRLPPDIVRIAPQYRDYDYTVIDDRIAIVDPRSRDVVDFVDEDSDYGRTASYGGDHVVITGDVRDRFRELTRRSSSTVGSTASSSGGSTCLSLQQVPEDLVRDHPELSKYRYLAIGDQAVLVDPQQQKIVQVID